MTAPPRSTTACAQPGCGGTILDGYCDVCGSPEPGSPDDDSRSTALVAPPLPTVAAASARPPGTALGSARVGVDGSRVTRRIGTSTTRLRGARLGAGLTSVPPVATVDPAAA